MAAYTSSGKVHGHTGMGGVLDNALIQSAVPRLAGIVLQWFCRDLISTACRLSVLLCVYCLCTVRAGGGFQEGVSLSYMDEVVKFRKVGVWPG